MTENSAPYFANPGDMISHIRKSKRVICDAPHLAFYAEGEIRLFRRKIPQFFLKLFPYE